MSFSQTFNPNPPPKDPVRMSKRLRHALITHRHESALCPDCDHGVAGGLPCQTCAGTGYVRLRYIDVAAAIGLSPSMLSQLLHGKVVGRGDPRLAKVGRYFELPEEAWEEPA